METIDFSVDGLRVLVIEPHPDDAFLSVGWHLERLWVGCRKTVLTVYADPRRAREAGAYAASVDAGHECLGLTESGMGSGGEVRRVPELLEWYESNTGGFDVCVIPVGLQHPDHKRVSVTRPADPELTVLRYVDCPYMIKQKLQAELRRKTAGLTVESVAFPPAKKWRHQSVFKSQAKFFHFNPMQGMCVPEVLLK